jgi:hypothetical protein
VIAALMPSALAVLAVAALVTSLAVWRGQDPAQPGAAASTTSARTANREALSQAPSTAATTSGPASATATKAAKKHTATAPNAAVHNVEVVVLNQTRRSGLAGTVADVLRGKGWTVRLVGNFRGVVPATTVYYPVGAEAAAQAAAEALPTGPRIRPRFGNLSTSRLTVVVTDSYPG